MDELISIIVPVYNAEKFSRETMDCVIAQTYPCWELLLVEDGSRDNSVEIIETYIRDSGEERIRLICQPENMGAEKPWAAGSQGTLYRVSGCG